MKKLFLSACTVICFLFAIAGTVQAAEPSRQQVVDLLNLMHARENIRVALDEQIKHFKTGMRQGFLSKMPNAPESTLNSLDKMVDTAMQELNVDELFEVSIPVYQKNLSAEEVKAMTDFYSTAAGQRILNKMPVILAESMQAGANVAQSKMKVILEKTDAAALNLLQELQKPAPTQED